MNKAPVWPRYDARPMRRFYKLARGGAVVRPSADGLMLRGGWWEWACPGCGATGRTAYMFDAEAAMQAHNCPAAYRAAAGARDA